MRKRHLGRRSSRATRSSAGAHDTEVTVRRGMATEGAEVDQAETMASTGDASDSFRQIASGTATGVGIDRQESAGTGGLAAGEDSDAVAAGDWWRLNLRTRDYTESDDDAPEVRRLTDEED